MLRGKWLGWSLGALFSAVSACSFISPMPEEGIERRLVLMGTSLEIQLVKPLRESAESRISLIYETIQACENQFSTWLRSSDLSVINQKIVRYEDSKIRKDLERVLIRSQKLEGAFHPGLGKWILASGARAGSWNPDALRRLSQRESVPQRPHDKNWVWEEGGFAKGLALDRVRVRFLEQFGEQVELSLNFGGQILHIGKEKKQISLGRPESRNEKFLEFWIQNESVSTSGQVENPGHIIDPFTGLSALDLGTVTVIHPSAELADMASTALLVLGPKRARNWWAQASRDLELSSMDWVWVERSGAVTLTCGLKKRGLTLLVSEPKVHWVGNCLTPEARLSY